MNKEGSRDRRHVALLRQATDLDLGISSKYGISYSSEFLPPQPQPGSFDLLGFTHYWARSRRGYWVIKRKTAAGRFTRALKRVAEWCRRGRHRPVREQHRDLSRKLRGHYGYYGITGNSAALSRFRHEVARIWWKWLARRSQRRLTWDRFEQLLERFPLPAAIATHSILRSAANP